MDAADPSDGAGTGSSLATEVLPFMGLLAQQGAASEGSTYTFAVDDNDGSAGAERFELRRKDTLHFIGLLNAPQIERHELGELFGRLDRGAVEGLTQRLFLALRNRSLEMAALQGEEVARMARAQRSRASGKPQTSQLRPPARKEPQRLVVAETAGPPPSARHHQDQFSPRPYSDATATPRSVDDIFRVVREARRSPRSSGDVDESDPLGSTASPRPSSSGNPLPKVFRRLTAPGYNPGNDEMARVRLSQPSGGTPPLPPSFSIRSGHDGPETAAFLEQVLLNREHGSRTQLVEELESQSRRSPRVPEQKAKEIFDRLCKSGKEYKVRRRVYAELGQLVEQTKVMQSMPGVPRVPLAAYKGDIQPEESVTERLYQEGLDRNRRRQDMMMSAPTPSFRPQTLSQLPIEYVMRPGSTGQLLGDGAREPTFARLHREHRAKLERQLQREEEMAQWKRHPYKPNITSSQKTGPQISRAYSMSRLGGGMEMCISSRDEVASQPAARTLLMTTSSTSSMMEAAAAAAASLGMGPGGMILDEEDDVEFVDLPNGDGHVEACVWADQDESEMQQNLQHHREESMPTMLEEDSGGEAQHEVCTQNLGLGQFRNTSSMFVETISRQASAATFQSGACHTPSSSPPMPMRNFSGRIIPMHALLQSGGPAATSLAVSTTQGSVGGNMFAVTSSDFLTGRKHHEGNLQTHPGFHHMNYPNHTQPQPHLAWSPTSLPTMQLSPVSSPSVANHRTVESGPVVQMNSYASTAAPSAVYGATSWPSSPAATGYSAGSAVRVVQPQVRMGGLNATSMPMLHHPSVASSPPHPYMQPMQPMQPGMFMTQSPSSPRLQAYAPVPSQRQSVMTSTPSYPQWGQSVMTIGSSPPRP